MKYGRAEGPLECGGLTPPFAFPFMPGALQGGVKPPHSKGLRTFSCKVVSRRTMKSSLWAGSDPGGDLSLLQVRNKVSV
jgi:hypothetical protein